MPATPTARLNLPFPAETDPADVPLDLGKLAQALDPLAAVDAQGTLSQRPAPTTRGAYYFATDAAILYRSDGTQWRAVRGSPINTYYTFPSGDIPWNNAGDYVAPLVVGTGHPDLVLSNGTLTAQQPMRLNMQAAAQINMAASGTLSWVRFAIMLGAYTACEDVRLCAPNTFVRFSLAVVLPSYVNSTTPIALHFSQGGTYGVTNGGSLAIAGDYAYDS